MIRMTSRCFCMHKRASRLVGQFGWSDLSKDRSVGADQRNTPSNRRSRMTVKPPETTKKQETQTLQSQLEIRNPQPKHHMINNHQQV